MHASGRIDVPPVKPRTRDADLRGHDRVSILLDLDRDYCTCYPPASRSARLRVRGLLGRQDLGSALVRGRARRADVLGRRGGDSAGGADQRRITTGRAWACNVVRVLPGRGVQAWSLPAEVPEETLRPEGMGLLIFTPNQAQKN